MRTVTSLTAQYHQVTQRTSLSRPWKMSAPCPHFVQQLAHTSSNTAQSYKSPDFQTTPRQRPRPRPSPPSTACSTGKHPHSRQPSPSNSRSAASTSTSSRVHYAKERIKVCTVRHVDTRRDARAQGVVWRAPGRWCGVALRWVLERVGCAAGARHELLAVKSSNLFR